MNQPTRENNAAAGKLMTQLSLRYLVLFRRGCKWLLDENKRHELNPCMEKIEKWFQFDTITLLDCVLTDDPINPEYSANTVYYRLEEVVNFHELYHGIVYNDVADFLLKNGYSSDDIELLYQKQAEESQRHSL